MVPPDLPDIPRTPTVIHSETRPRIVELVVDIPSRNDIISNRLNEAQTAFLRLAHHPVESHQRHPLFGVAYADIRMYARKPYLVYLPVPRALLVPEFRTKSASFIIYGQGMTGTLDLLSGRELVEPARANPVDKPPHLVNGHPHRTDCVPHAIELDLGLYREATQLHCALAHRDPPSVARLGGVGQPHE